MYNIFYCSFQEIKNLLRHSSDADEIIILLSIAEFNLISEIESDKNLMKQMIKDNKMEQEDEDDLLSSLDQTIKKEEETSKTQKLLKSEVEEKKQLLEKIRKIIRVIADRPMDFVGEEPIRDINEKLNRNLLPFDKSIRSCLAKDVLYKLIDQKENDMRLDKKNQHPSEF